MTEDFLRSLGHLALGSRMKRLGERLQAQTEAILEDAGIALPASQFPFLAALDAEGPMTVGDLAAAMGVAQPGVTRTLASLEKEGIIASKTVTADRRIRLISLTADGKRLVARAKKKAWPAIERAVADACADLKGPLLSQVSGLENALQAAPLLHRLPNKKRRANA